MAIPTPTTKTFGRLFDLHFEIGLNPGGDFYARTILGNGGLMMEQPGATPAQAIAKLGQDLESSNFWALIMANPSMVSYPFGTAPSTNTQPTAKIPDPNVPRKKPMELTQVSHPDCQVLCTSFDHFGKAKCKSMCGQRTGL